MANKAHGWFVHELAAGGAVTDNLIGDKTWATHNYNRMITGFAYCGSAVDGDTTIDINVGQMKHVMNWNVNNATEAIEADFVIPCKIPVPRGKTLEVKASATPTTNPAFIGLRLTPQFGYMRTGNVGVFTQEIVTTDGVDTNVLKGNHYQTCTFDRILSGVGLVGSTAIDDCGINVVVGGEEVIENHQLSIPGAGCDINQIIPVNVLVRGGRNPDRVQAYPTASPTTNSAWLTLKFLPRRF